MANRLKSWILGPFVVLLSASPVLAGDELVSETAGDGTSRVDIAGPKPGYRFDLASRSESDVSHFVDSSGAVNIVKRGPRKPDVPVVTSTTDELEAAIKSKALRDSARDPVIRSIIEQPVWHRGARSRGRESTPDRDVQRRILGGGHPNGAESR